MAVLPHDITDLRLAPVALALDAVIADLGRLPLDKLANQVERYRDVSDATPETRRQWLLDKIESCVEIFQWTLSFDARGIRLAHDEHTLVLGAPATFSAYIDGGALR